MDRSEAHKMAILLAMDIVKSSHTLETYSLHFNTNHPAVQPQNIIPFYQAELSQLTSNQH